MIYHILAMNLWNGGIGKAGNKMALVSREEHQNAATLRSLSLKSSWIFSGDLRLDADYYAKEKDLALRILNDKRFSTRPLKTLVQRKMFSGYRFKRIYAGDKEKGIPYLSATETLMFRPKSERYLSKSKTENLDDLLVKEGWILMTCSGVIGRLTIVDKNLSQFVLTHDLIRIIPNEEEIPSGYLYAFLSTWIAQSVVTRDQYGLAINHVEPHQIEDLAVPILDKKIMGLFDHQIKYAYSLRQQANKKLDEAEALFYDSAGLTREIDNPLKNRKSFSLKSSSLDTRLDASFHNPVLIETLRMLRKSSTKLVKTKDLGKVIVAPRFKRIYVEKEYGIPFLQGSDLPMNRPFNLKYLSRKMTASLNNWIIKPGWTLVTCSGTIGRIGLTTPITDGWAASQHILRIIPHKDKPSELEYPVDAAYIATFLSTPYGYNQVVAKTYGGVVDEIGEKDIGQVLIAVIHDQSVHNAISQLTREAYAFKDLAALVEHETVSLLENLLEGSIKFSSVDNLRKALEETIELKAKVDSVNKIYEGINEVDEGYVVSFDDIKSKYGL
ncbi:restriction endonuclease S subunit [Candidatus Nitrososphaera evergladensis SR1]|uniref:Restriction endonuclease S subunit n=2 Tax=Nitrososphaera TaxID=497726 RepID=A0A075MM82_9ARCH|nr:restriction endonuclease S subunit [Candidatus Nitrososphaera evergladensis SR1]AIF83215.1 restriction endonuclease S subunit [Candidatus Nitrososphaera evergladensis SR1]